MGVSGSFVTIVDDQFQYIKCTQNLPPLATTVHLDETMCQHSVHSSRAIICNDTRRDPRFSSYPLVINEPVIFYAAAPLKTHDGEVFGTLCLPDNQPYSPNLLQIDQLLQVAKLTSEYLQFWYCVGHIDPLTGLPNRNSMLNEISCLTFSDTPETYAGEHRESADPHLLNRVFSGRLRLCQSVKYSHYCPFPEYIRRASRICSCVLSATLLPAATASGAVM